MLGIILSVAFLLVNSDFNLAHISPRPASPKSDLWGGLGTAKWGCKTSLYNLRLLRPHFKLSLKV